MNELHTSHANATQEIMEKCPIDYQIERALVSAEEALTNPDDSIQIRITLAGMVGRLRAIKKDLETTRKI
jgi:hypothetical protein